MLKFLLFINSFLICSIAYSNNYSIGFNGQRSDSATHYQFLGNGYRAYNPMIKRFMAYDSMSPFEKGGVNGYVYGANNPVMYSDPSGMSPRVSFFLEALILKLGNYLHFHKNQLLMSGVILFLTIR